MTFRTLIFKCFFWAFWLLSLPFYKITVKGRENIPEGPFVVVPNHVGYIDGFVIASAFWRPFSALMWYEKYNIAPWFFKLWGAIPVASRNEDRFLAARAVQLAQERLMNGESIMIFPEGGLRKPEEGPLAYRKGYNYLRPQSHDGGYVVPLVPVTLSGIYGSFWSYEGGNPGTGKSRFFGRRRHITVQIHKPMFDIEPQALQQLIEDAHPEDSPEARHNREISKDAS